MRRIIVLLALISSSALFLAATPNPAAAANCSSGQSATYWNGLLNFDARLTNCTGVDAVEFRNTDPYPSGWQDVTTGFPKIATSPTGAIQTGGPGMTGATLTFSHPAWCGGAAHVVHTFWAFRIHNSATHTWGSLFTSVSVNYAINC